MVPACLAKKNPGARPGSLSRTGGLLQSAAAGRSLAASPARASAPAIRTSPGRPCALNKPESSRCSRTCARVNQWTGRA
jgi:hypothetical protein